jgi:cell division protein FtsN
VAAVVAPPAAAPPSDGGSVAAALEDIAPAEAPSGKGPWVQIGAFSDRKAAERGWSQLKRSNGDILEGRNHQVVPVTAGDTRMRLQVGPFADDGDAAKFCDSLRQRNGVCFVVGR